MKQITLILFLLNIWITTSQEEQYNAKSLDVTISDVQTKTFTKDSSAHAFVIYEQGNSYVDNNEYKLHTEIKHKIKILNQEGFRHANVAIYLYKNKNSEEKVVNIKAKTFNEDQGKITTTHLLKKDIYTEAYNENFNIVKFTLPNIQEGSVITYSYEIVSEFMFKYHGWKFQSDIPKLYSEYKASIPGNWLYNIKLVGQEKLDVSESEIKKECLTINGATADCGNTTYGMKNIPAFIEEDYMTTESNYLSRIEYELKTFKGMDGSIKHYTKTWEDVDREFRTEKEIGRQIKKTIKLEELLNPDIISETDILKKADAIYEHIQNNYTWNGDYKIFTNVSLKNLLKTHTGNVSSINILLHNLLREAQIDVKPVLLSTRDNGFVTTLYPVISDFNYLIVQATINNETYFLDATDKYLSFGEIPFRCLNNKARVLDFKNGSHWIDIIPKNRTTTMYSSMLNLNENNTVSGKIKTNQLGYHAISSKKKYYSNNDAYIDKLEAQYPNLEISNHEVLTENQRSKKFTETYDINIELDNDGGEFLYINPFIVTFFSENPFKLQQRSYPIDFGYPDSYIYTLNLNFDPEKFEVVELPKKINAMLPNNEGSVSFLSIPKENYIQLSFRIQFKNALYPAAYYPYLKELMNQVVDIQTNSLILLKRK